jgi:hypothetical protein
MEHALLRSWLIFRGTPEPALPPSPTTEEVKSQTKQIRIRSRMVMQQMEVARQRRQQKLELSWTIKQMRAAGIKGKSIARQLGLCRRHIDKWIQLDELPERSRMSRARECSNRSETIYVSVGKRAVRHGRTLLAEIRKLGYVRLLLGTRKNSFRRGASRKQRSKRVSPRSSDAPQLEVTTSTTSRPLPLTI